MPTHIGCKELGGFAMPGACQFDLWIRTAVGGHFPFNIFPGIFSSFDSINKRMVHDHLDRYGAPEWFEQMPKVKGWEEPKRMSFYHVETGVRLTGEPDGVFPLAEEDGVTICDYKTARLTGGQDTLMPMYTVQQNGYAWLRRMLGLAPAKYLYLVYMDPQTFREDIKPADYIKRHAKGYQLDFDAKIVPVELKPDDFIPALLAEVAAMSALKQPPEGNEKCRNCRDVEGLVTVAMAKFAKLDQINLIDVLTVTDVTTALRSGCRAAFRM